MVALLAVDAFAFHAGFPSRLLGASAPDKLATAPGLSIVVLPFEDLSGDKEQDYFADGITDDLTTDLSHLPDSFVIARNRAFTYKVRAPTRSKLAGNSASAICSKAACAGSATRSRSTPSLFRPTRERMSGRAVRQAARRSLRHAGRNRRAAGRRAEYQSCRGRGRDAPNKRRPPARWASIFRVWLGTIRF